MCCTHTWGRCAGLGRQRIKSTEIPVGVAQERAWHGVFKPKETATMSIDFTPEQLQIRDSVTRLCARFGDQYWLERDADGRFPEEFCSAIADHGYMGIAMPSEYGGAGLGITEAAILMQAISQSGAGNGGLGAERQHRFELHLQRQ